MMPISPTRTHRNNQIPWHTQLFPTNLPQTPGLDFYKMEVTASQPPILYLTAIRPREHLHLPISDSMNHRLRI